MEDYSLEDLLNLNKDDKSSFWKMMYEKVKESVRDEKSYAVILEFKENSSESDEMVEVTSFMLDEDQFYPLLENYLIFCERLEEYETCIEIKQLMERVKSKRSIKKLD